MFYDIEDSAIDDAGHRLSLAKVRTKEDKPGKYGARPKADRPQDKFASIKAKRCDKKKITDIDIAKSIITSARWSRATAAADGRTSRRHEERWYICEHCPTGNAKIYHVTTLTEEQYAVKFEASARGEFSLAA